MFHRYASEESPSQNIRAASDPSPENFDVNTAKFFCGQVVVNICHTKIRAATESLFKSFWKRRCRMEDGCQVNLQTGRPTTVREVNQG